MYDVFGNGNAESNQLRFELGTSQTTTNRLHFSGQDAPSGAAVCLTPADFTVREEKSPTRLVKHSTGREPQQCTPSILNHPYPPMRLLCAGLLSTSKETQDPSPRCVCQVHNNRLGETVIL